MTSPEPARLLRTVQITMQYELNTYLNDKPATAAQVADAAGVSEVVVKQMAAGKYNGLLPYLYAVALAIGKVPVLTFNAVSV